MSSIVSLSLSLLSSTFLSQCTHGKTVEKCCGNLSIDQPPVVIPASQSSGSPQIETQCVNIGGMHKMSLVLEVQFERDWFVLLWASIRSKSKSNCRYTTILAKDKSIVWNCRFTIF